MDAYSMSPADGRLADLVSRAERGENVDIVREGRVVARLVPAVPPPATLDVFDWPAYRAWARATLPHDATNSVAEMRKQARY